jgi:hypothetical protein
MLVVSISVMVNVGLILFGVFSAFRVGLPKDIVGEDSVAKSGIARQRLSEFHWNNVRVYHSSFRLFR